MKHVLAIAGTRPEIIKLAPVVLQARTKFSSSIKITFCLTGQHQQLADQAMKVFGLHADANLDIMQRSQSIHDIVVRVQEKLPPLIDSVKPDVIFVQGDTSSAAAAAMSAYHMRIPVGHVEAGLRSYDLYAPFPEESNRRIITACARFNFCPTQNAFDNLEREGIDTSSLFVTGNTIVDALHMMMASGQLEGTTRIPTSITQPFVLVTAHRRESFGEGFVSICSALRECSRLFPKMQFVYPVHLNPQVHGPVEKMLSQLPNVVLLEPLPYVELLTLLKNSAFVITDSGGIQEEAPSFGKYCIVMRSVTERMESVHAGMSELVGTNAEQIVRAVRQQITQPTIVDPGKNPYGDGHAAQRILEIVSAA